MSRVAVVTGANKGLGLAITERLCKTLRDGWSVYLTSRCPVKGSASLEQLQSRGLAPWFHQLDVTSDNSIREFTEHLDNNHGRVDVLVNNAGVMIPMNKPVSEQLSMLHTNFFGSLNLTRALTPLLRPHARLVHVAGMVGPPALKQLSEEKRAEFLAADTEDKLVQIVQQYMEQAESGADLRKSGLTKAMYGYSKLALMALAHVQQVTFDEDTTRDDIVVNSCCPGLCKTDMSGGKGKKTPEEGSDTPVYLATLPPEIDWPRGQYVTERRIQEWRT